MKFTSPTFEGVARRPHPSPFLERWGRRVGAIAIYLLAWAALVVTYPVVVVIAVVLDGLKRNNWAGARTLTFFLLYFTWELLGAFVCLLLWLFSGVWAGASHARFLRWNYMLQVYWVIPLMRCLLFVFSAKLKVEGDYDFRKRPFILFIRHASVTDTLFPPYLAFLQRVHLRFVLKRELLWDPCLELSFNRLPNYFVERGSRDSEREIEMVGHLMDDLTANEGVLIYPEGTRFTEAKKQRVLEKIREGGDKEALRRAESLQRVLPPRPGGPLKLLEKNASCDALFCSHTGLERTTSFDDLWNGGIVGTTVYFKFWRIPFEEIPRDREAQTEWLHQEWKKVDEFVIEHGPEQRNGG